MSNGFDMDGLPPDARTAVLGLIGSTFAELKKVDEHLITKNQFTAGIKTDLKKLINEANSLVAPPPQAQQPQIQHQQPVLQPIPVAVELQPTVAVSAPQIVEDPNQLQFDFYKKITPEDIHSKLTDINLSLTTILEKLNKVVKILTNGDKNRQ
jgi:hypothetical protein